MKKWINPGTLEHWTWQWKKKVGNYRCHFSLPTANFWWDCRFRQASKFFFGSGDIDYYYYYCITKCDNDRFFLGYHCCCYQKWAHASHWVVQWKSICRTKRKNNDNLYLKYCSFQQFLSGAAWNGVHCQKTTWTLSKVRVGAKLNCVMHNN